MIFIYALFALAMLAYRVHSVALSRRMLRVKTESLATQRLARTFLALRDFTNTPLQTIELAAKIVRKRCPEMTPTLDRVDRSIDRLYRLNHAFSVYESQIEWTDKDVSPDPSVLVDQSRASCGRSGAVNPAAPAAFLFDLDGTLVDSERENIESVVRAARRHGVELSEEERQFVIGHSWNEIHGMVSRNHGLAVPMHQLIAEAVAEKRALIAVSGFRPLPGAVNAVKRFARTSKLAVVTGASTAEAIDALVGIGVRDYMAVLVAAEDYTQGKPAPEPYAQAIARLGVDARQSIAIEDATPGILSARAAGARVIAVRAGNFAGYDLSAADVVVDTLDDITADVCARLLP